MALKHLEEEHLVVVAGIDDRNIEIDSMQEARHGRTADGLCGSATLPFWRLNIIMFSLYLDKFHIFLYY